MDIACQRFMQIGNERGLIASTEADAIVAQTRFSAKRSPTRIACSSITLSPACSTPELLENRPVTVEERPLLSEHRHPRAPSRGFQCRDAHTEHAQGRAVA
jgi:hypothetical protein